MTVVVKTTVTPDVAAALRAQADREERSVAQVIRLALREYVEQQKAR